MRPHLGHHAAASSGRSRVAGLAIVALLGLAVAGCSDDTPAGTAGPAGTSGPSGDPALPTDEALAAIQELTGRVAPAGGESIELDVCPMGDMETLVAQGPSSVQDLAIGVPNTYQYVFQSELAGEHPFVTCVLEPDDANNVGLSVGQVVPDFKEDTVRVLSAFTLTFEPEYAYLGGTVLQYCAVPLEDDAAFCEVDWYDGNIWVGVFITTDDRSVEDAEAWLQAIMLGVLGNIIATAPAATAT